MCHNPNLICVFFFVLHDVDFFVAKDVMSIKHSKFMDYVVSPKNLIFKIWIGSVYIPIHVQNSMFLL